MRPLILFALAVLAPSCGGTSSFVFTGQNAGGGDLTVEGHKRKGAIVVVDGVRGFGIALPYAEDWVFEPTARKPVSAKSTSLQLFVTVQLHQPGRKVEEESYLRDEYLKNLKAAKTRWEREMKDVAITKQGDHFVLEYVTVVELDGAPFVQTHFWTFRQRDDGWVFEAHLSTVRQSEPERGKLCAELRQILGGEFHVLPIGGR